METQMDRDTDGKPPSTAGERTGFADALRYVTEGRAGGGLVGHLAGSTLRDPGGAGRGPLD